MALVKLIEYRDAPPAVKSVYDDIMKTRGVDWINNFWKALANDPRELARVWRNVKQVMAPGALDPLLKEMVYVAVSATNGCEYCTYSHTAAARKRGMTDAMLMELLAVVGLANETNRLANSLRIDVDWQFTPQEGCQLRSRRRSRLWPPGSGSRSCSSSRRGRSTSCTCRSSPRRPGSRSTGCHGSSWPTSSCSR